MHDAEIERIASNDGKWIHPEVLKIIEKEIRIRNLNKDLINGLYAQNKTYTSEELKYYSDIIRALPCPICESNSTKLNGTCFEEITGFVFVIVNKVAARIACPNCLDKIIEDANQNTLLMGWLDLPFGLLKTYFIIRKNNKIKLENRIDSANNSLNSFVLGNIGEIELIKNNPQKLNDYLNHMNK